MRNTDPSGRIDLEKRDAGLQQAKDQAEAINRDLLALNATHQSLFSCRTVEDVAKVLTRALVEDFGAYFSRVWLKRPGDLCAECALAAHCPSKEECLHLIASCGYYTHVDGDHRRVPLGAFKIGLIAQGRGKTISNDVVNDERVHDRHWAQQLGLQSFAGFPIVRDGRVIGVMAMFSQQKLAPHLLDTLDILAAVGASAVGNVEQLETLEQRHHQLEKNANQIAETNETLRTSVADLAQAMNELARTNQEMDEFSYVASHDLQEPLRKLISFSSLLEKDLGGDLPGPAKQDLDFIVDAAHRMSMLVQDLLSLSRVGRGPVKREPVSLDACVDWALHSLASRVEEAKAEIRRDELPEVAGDPTLLTQLYQNLIGNALKFVPAGQTPVVHVTAEFGSGLWTLGVRDNGIGIKPEYAEQIFVPFKRLHGRRDYPGTGIGLAICRKTVERHGGTITLESEPGKGSHFRFTLNATSEAEQDLPATEECPASTA